MHNAYIFLNAVSVIHVHNVLYNASASLETGKNLGNKAGSCGSDQGTVLPPTSELCLAAILPSVGG